MKFICSSNMPSFSTEYECVTYKVYYKVQTYLDAE